MARGETETAESYKKWLLNLIKDFRSPDKDNFENVVKSDGEQKKRQYEDAKADAARTGSAEDIAYAKKMQELVNIYEDVVKARKLTDEAQKLYNNIDANRKKIESLKALGEGNTDEAKKIQRQLTRARAGLQSIESERDAFGKSSKKETKPVVEETPLATEGTATPVAKAPTAKKPTVKEEATTRNPVTGEVIKVSDIKPANGSKPTPTVGGPTTMPPVDREAAAGKIVTAADFGLSEALFKNIPSLKAIFDQYTDPKSGMTDDEFRKLIRQDVWYKQNSKEIKNRFVQFYNYEDLKNSGQATGATDYEKQIATIEANLTKRAVELGSAAANDPAAIRKAAENLYLTDRSEDESFITDFLASSIKPVSGMIGGKVTEGYSGDALKNYNALLQTARNNGFKISDILPGGGTEQQVLAGIASGKIDINRVAQDARKLAAQGQPQYVRDLLSQGYDLAQVFAPYRQTMANVLEIGDPDQIDLNDPLLRTAITDKGDMNVYDFKKALRQDSRWQYTEQAKKDVSNAALGVLRDFGFQG